MGNLHRELCRACSILREDRGGDEVFDPRDGAERSGGFVGGGGSAEDEAGAILRFEEGTAEGGVGMEDEGVGGLVEGDLKGEKEKMVVVE